MPRRLHAETRPQADTGSGVYRLVILAAGLGLFAALALLRAAGADTLYAAFFRLWGVDINFTPYFPFVDFHEILAAMQCHRQGVDVFLEDPCDALGRVHVYSPVWLMPAFTGLGPADTPWMGALWVIAFVAMVAWIANAKTGRETAIYLLALLSPASLFALERANIDLIMFLLVVGAAFAFCRSPLGRLVAYGMIGLAASLKFYPIAAMSLALYERKSRFIAVAVASVAAVAVFASAIWSDLEKIWPNIPRPGPTIEAWGGLNLFEGELIVLTAVWRGHGDALRTFVTIQYIIAILASVGLSLHLAQQLRSRGWSLGALNPETALFVAGGLIIVFCFFSGKNGAYRGVWLITLLPFLIRRWRESRPGDVVPPVLWGRGIALLLVLLWFEALRRNAIDAFGTYVAGRFAVGLIREPAWWIFITGLMTMLWTQILASEIGTILPASIRRADPASARS